MEQYRPSSRILPPVIKNLIIINAIMLLATMAASSYLNKDLQDILGLHYIKSDHFAKYQIFTHMFMHGGWLHLFSNMFALWMFGSMLENVWGPKRFLLFYLVCGVGAAVIYSIVVYFQMQSMHTAVQHIIDSGTFEQAQAYVTKHHLSTDGCTAADWRDQFQCIYLNQVNEPMVGASGAVFGVLAAFALLFPNTLLYVYFLFPIKAKWFVLFYAGFELYATIHANPGDNIAHTAHLGGALFGFILVKYWNRTRKEFF